MNTYFNGHEKNTGFSSECPEKNFPKQTEKSTKNARLRKISSQDNYVENLIFYTMQISN